MTCSLCERKHYGHGLCARHYQQARRAGRLANPVCACGRPEQARGKCHRCYMRAHREGLFQKVCKEWGCRNPALTKERCGPHLGYAEAHPIRELVRSRAKVYGVTELQYARDNLGANIHYYSRDWWTPNMADRICTNLGVWSGDYLA